MTSASGPEEIIAAAAIRPAGRHNVSNALAAAAMARAYGVPVTAIRDGLAGYVPEPHRNALVATVGRGRLRRRQQGDQPARGLASLTAYPRIVWVAGGQLKGVDIDDLVAAVADRLVGAVLLGVDRAADRRGARATRPARPRGRRGEDG